MSNTTHETAAGRIAALLDESSFVEIGSLVSARNTDFNLQEQDTPADGVITGYGTIDGALCYVYSQDASVLGGAIGEMHAKKITSLYQLAMKMGAPVVGIVDCAGLRLQEATDALAAFGEMFYTQSMASGVIPQITAVFGTCGGGMALVPGLTDFTFMEEKDAKLFVNSPNALAGNTIEKCNTSTAAFQSEETGMVDFVGSEEEIFAKIRELIGILPANNAEEAVFDECTDDLNRLCDGIEAGTQDTVYALSQISDNGYFLECRQNYGKEMVTGFIRLNGATVGAVANRSAVTGEDGEAAEEFATDLTTEGCSKAAGFVNFCDAFDIPVLTLTNVTGFKADKDNEKTIARAASKLTYSFTNATVPKVNVIVGKAFGSAGVVMNSKSIGADIVYAWPDASVGMMDATEAVKIMYAKEISESDSAAALISEKASSYADLQSSAKAAARRGYVDDIIDPATTRKRVIAAFEMLCTKRETRPLKKHGTV